MIVGINARVLATKNIRGWSRYTCNLIRGLHQKNISLFLFSDQEIEKKWVPKELHSQIIVRSGYNYIHWEQWVLPRLCEEYGVDILHCPINYGVPFYGSFKKVLTVHDAIEKSYYDQFKTLKEKLSWLQFKIRGLHYLSQSSADRIITVSEFAKKDIVTSYGVSPDRVDVVYEAADELFNTSNVLSAVELKNIFNIDPGYYFYVGGLEKRKNIELLLNIAKKLESSPFRLVIAGGEKSHIEHKNIKYLGYVDENHLPSLYAHSKCLIYPSFHEGFGLQIVESLQMGRPAIYANTTSLAEIYGSEAYGFSPHSVEEALGCISKIENQYAMALEYVHERKIFFNWQKTIDETVQIYKNILL